MIILSYVYLAKMQIPRLRIVKVYAPILFRFVSQQSEFAFFGAPTSVGAPFYFWRKTMDIYRVSFFGHRSLTSTRKIEENVERMVKELIRTKEYVEFYVGRNGDYDICVASCIKRAQKAMGNQNSALVLVLPYVVKDIEYYRGYYDDIILPIDEKTHFKAAVTKRNRWMIENSDLVIAFVERRSGGAYNGLSFAQKRGVKTVNLGEMLH